MQETSIKPSLFEQALEDSSVLQETINQIMPFGKYKGLALLELPEPYLVWFHQQGFPKGKLGEQLALMYEIKLNGLEAMLKPLLTHPANHREYRE